MKEENTTRFTWEEWDESKGQTDWERVRNLTDEDIKQAVESDPDAAPILDDDDEFWRNAKVVHPPFHPPEDDSGSE